MPDVFPSFHVGVFVVICTAVTYLFVMVCMRLLGKTEVAQLSVADLVFIMLIGNSLQGAMIGSSPTIGAGILAASTLFLMNYVLKRLRFFNPAFAKRLKDGPVALVTKGHINQAALTATLITRDQLYEAIREHGIARISEVDYALLEEDGNISVLSKSATSTKQPHHSRRRPHRITKKS